MWRSTSRKTDATARAATIRGRIVALVPLSARHVGRTLEWTNDAELMRLLNRAQHVSADEHTRWFEALRVASDRVYMAIEEVGSGHHIGNVWLSGIDQRDLKAELRIVIGDPGATGRGAGTEAIDLMCRYAFESLSLHRIYAYVLAFNGRAKRAFERAGFSAEGILRADRISEGRRVDVYVLGRLPV